MSSHYNSPQDMDICTDFQFLLGSSIPSGNLLVQHPRCRTYLADRAGSLLRKVTCSKERMFQLDTSESLRI